MILIIRSPSDVVLERLDVADDQPRTSWLYVYCVAAEVLVVYKERRSMPVRVMLEVVVARGALVGTCVESDADVVAERA